MTAARTRKATGRAAAVALVAGAVLFSLAALELGCRLLSRGPEALAHWPNYRVAQDRAGTRRFRLFLLTPIM